MNRDYCHNRKDLEKIQPKETRCLYKREMEILDKVCGKYLDLHYWIECKSNREHDILICNKFNNLITITIYQREVHDEVENKQKDVKNYYLHINISFSNQGRMGENSKVWPLSNFNAEDIRECFNLINVLTEGKSKYNDDAKTIYITYKSINEDSFKNLTKVHENLIKRLLEKKCSGLYYGNGYKLNDAYQEEVLRTRLLIREREKIFIDKSSKKPTKREETRIVFVRSPYVEAAVLERANGICENCHKPAPFIKAKDGMPYLEVHHKIRLADGGEDTVENAMGVCPNCHRELHYGLKTI